MRNTDDGRFVIWDLATDSYSKDQYNTNWKRLAALIGGPGGSPGGHDPSIPPKPLGTPSTWLSLGDQNNDPYGRSLYNVISGLNYNDAPLGSVILYWRPSPTVSLPDGWVPADGSTYTNNTAVSPPIKLHSYPLTSVTVPDMRNAIAVGAYETDTNTYVTSAGPVELGRDGLAGSITDRPVDAPGIGAKGGTNVPRNMHHYHDPGSYAMPLHRHIHVHVHNMSNHSHDFTHVHYVGNHQHNTNAHVHGLSNHYHNVDHWHLMGHHEHVIDWQANNGRHVNQYIPLFYTPGGAAAISGGPFQYGFYPLADSITGFAQNSDGVFDTAQGPRTHSKAESGFGPNSGGPVPNVSDPSAIADTSFPVTVAAGATLRTGGPEWPDTVPHNTTSPPSVPFTGNALTTSGASADFTGNQDVSGITGQSGSTPFTPGGDPTAVDMTAMDIRQKYVALLYIVKIKVAENLV